MTGTLVTLWRWLGRGRRTQLSLLFGLSLLGAVAELATLGALLPFIALLSNPDRALSYPLFESILVALDWSETEKQIIPVTLIFFAIILAAAAVRLTLVWTTARFSRALGHDIALRVYDRVLHQPYSYHVSRNTSEVIAGVQKVDLVITGVLSPALDVVVAAIAAIAIIGGLFLIDWMVATLAAGLFGFIYLVISQLSRTRVLGNSRVISANTSLRIQALQEGLGGIRDTILDGSQSLHLKRFDNLDGALRRAQAEITVWALMPRYLVEAIGVGIIAGLAIFTSAKEGGLLEALPLLGALAIGAQRLLPLFQRIYAGWNSVTGNHGNLTAVALLANAPVMSGSKEKGNAASIRFNQQIRLREVGFSYRADLPWIFQDINLSIPKGSRVGFVGKTGCGKSTLLDLVMGLLTPTAGQILVDDAILTPENLRHWQAHIAHVPQNIFLADASIAANIALGNDHSAIDMARVEMAAQMAKIHDYIKTLNDGYETTVGERGVRLSGGQRQRVGIARALYRNADVLILDEATSALDGETEASVMSEIEDLGGNVTVLIVAHRLSTLSCCDLVVKMGESAKPQIQYLEPTAKGAQISQIGQSMLKTGFPNN